MHELVTTTDSGTLRVVFFREGDRFAYRLESERGSATIELARSREGSSDEAWPVSPAVQEVHQQDGLLFLTGAAGTSYWSASVSAPEPGVLEFDWACRFKQSPSQLGVSYEVLADGLRFAAVQSAEVIASAELLRIEASFETKTASGPATARWLYRIRLSA